LVKVIDQMRCIRELFERRVRQGEDLRVLRRPPRDAELWVVCTTGHHATIAASLLDRVDVPVRLVARRGTVGCIERLEEPATAGLRTA
jgi:hypothetical protein